MLNILASFGVGVLGWIAAHFLGKPMLDFRMVRQEIQEELTFLGDVYSPRSQIYYEATGKDYEKEVEAFHEAGEKSRRLGAKLAALHTSLGLPLRYALRYLGYDLDKAAKFLLRLSTELEDDRRKVCRYRVECALRLPLSGEHMAKAIIKSWERTKAEALKRTQRN
jgi:hypothetical protein